MSRKKIRPATRCENAECREPIDGEHRGGCAVGGITLRLCQRDAKRLFIDGARLHVTIVDATPSTVAPGDGRS